MTAVRDSLKRVGRKEFYGSFGESTECSVVYRGGIPRGHVSSFDRVTKTADSSKKIGSTLVVYSIFDDGCDCSASRHPSFDELVRMRTAIPQERTFTKVCPEKVLSPMNNLLTDIWAEETSRIYRANLNFVKALFDPHYTNPQKYAQ